MSETMTFATTPSPGFTRARKLSRFMAVIFTIGFGVTLLVAVLILGTPLEPIIDPGGHGVIEGYSDLKVSLDGLSMAQCAWVMLAMEMTILPVLFLLHHARRVFGHFAKGEIFVLPVIVHIRQAGLWLFISFFANIASHVALAAAKLIPNGQTHGSTWPLLIGVTTTIAAYVMEEARRIAADNAEIV